MVVLVRVLLCAAPLVIVSGSAPALVGCGGARDATDKQIESLQGELVKLRAENAILSERLDAVEIAQGTFRGGAGGSGSAGGSAGGSGEKDKARAAGSKGAGGDDRPDLAVVRLTPSSSSDPGAEETDGDEGPRPVLRSVSGGGVIEDKAPAITKASEAAQRDYDDAYDLFKSKSYDKSIEAFTAFLSRYPDHDNADNAVYWRGESYLAKGETKRAAEQFEAVVSTYPKGNKAPDALLRLAQCRSTLGDAAGADAARKKLRASYPTSDAAKKLERSAAGKKP